MAISIWGRWEGRRSPSGMEGVCRNPKCEGRTPSDMKSDASQRLLGLTRRPGQETIVTMKATTMTLSEKRQSVFPRDWCERVGLARGGQVNVFDLGEHGLLIRPVKPPTRRELAAALAAARPSRNKPGEAERIVAKAPRKVRFASLSLKGRYT